MIENIYNLLVGIANKADELKNLIQTSIDTFKILSQNIISVLSVNNGMSLIFTPMLIMIHLSIVFIAIDLARDLI